MQLPRTILQPLIKITVEQAIASNFSGRSITVTARVEDDRTDDDMLCLNALK